MMIANDAGRLRLYCLKAVTHSIPSQVHITCALSLMCESRLELEYKQSILHGQKEHGAPLDEIIVSQSLEGYING